MKSIGYCLLCMVATSFFSSASAKDTIDIAAIYALTGSASEDNISSVEAVRFGINELNRKGGILGKQIRLLVLDNQSSPIGSHIAARRAAGENVTAIIGAAWSSHSIAIAKVAQEKGIPMISNLSTHPDVTKIGDYVFRVCFTDDFQGDVMARFARYYLKASTAVVFVDLTSDYSTEFSRIFRKDFERIGGEILFEAEYKLKDKNYDQLIIQAKKANADVIFLSGHDESGGIAKFAQDAGVRSIPIGGDGWVNQSFFDKGGMYLRRGYYCSHWSEFVDSDLSRSFVEKYNGKTDSGTALGYDAVMVLFDAIKRANSTEKSKIRDALANTKSFNGVTGVITFDANGDPVKSAVIMEIIDGKACYLKTLEP